MQKKRYVWSILPGLFLLIGVVAGYGSGCNGTVVGPEDEIPTVDNDAFDEEESALAAALPKSKKRRTR